MAMGVSAKRNGSQATIETKLRATFSESEAIDLLDRDIRSVGTVKQSRRVRPEVEPTKSSRSG
jgi:hypothetical protein